MREIKAICRPERLEHVVQALHAIGNVPGVTISRVEGVGRLQAEVSATPTAPTFGRREMAKVEIVVSDDLADRVITAIAKAARTGRPGDGKIFAVKVDEAIRIRSGERGDDAL